MLIPSADDTASGAVALLKTVGDQRSEMTRLGSNVLPEGSPAILLVHAGFSVATLFRNIMSN